MNWPNGADFAFTIIDDTDNATVINVLPVYNLLKECKIYTTKTVWVYPPIDNYAGGSLADGDYLDFIKNLKEDGFEIALHGVGSGDYQRELILKGLDEYNRNLGCFPNIHINHSKNKSNLYWGFKRFIPPISTIMSLTKRHSIFEGENSNSKFFWGDIAKVYIKYIRNLTFSGINTIKYDPLMPYVEKNKSKFSNFWFSSSDGHTINEFNKLLSKKNIDKLITEKGCCIVYTHFASGFVKESGELDASFKSKIEYLAAQNGWFVPASTLLDFLQHEKTNNNEASFPYLCRLNFRWLIDRIIKFITFGR